jgi:hypothetical protein
LLTSSGRSVSIVRLQAKSHGGCLFCLLLNSALSDLLLVSFFFSANKEHLMLDFFLEMSPQTIKLTEQSSGSSVRGGQIASLFDRIQARLSPELVSKTSAVFHFVVKGEQFLKNGVFWDVTPCGSCKNQRFGGT